MVLMRRSLLLILLLLLPFAAGCPGGGPGEPGGDTSDVTATDTGMTDTTDQTTTDVPPAQVFVRPNMGKLDPNGPEIAALRTGVAAMKARPASDPTSWLYQANIHGTYDTPALAQWNTCQHGNYFFLSWHRMYLYYFERILRKASGDPNFALPFWDYTDPTQRAIPAALRNPANAQNPLFVAERAPGINTGAQVPASATTFTQAMAFTNFTSPTGSPLSFGGQLVPGPVHFGGIFGQLENQPHNIIHVVVGGDDGWMSDPNLAARDPVFWLHHANIDRLWNVWLSRGGGRTNPDDNGWKTQIFTFFDENGQAVQMTGQQVVDSAAQLNYRYAEGSGDTPSTEALTDLPAAPFTDNKRTVIVDKPVNARLRGERASVGLTIPAASQEGVGGDQGRLTLVLDGIKFGRPGIYYEVYANLPPNAQPVPTGPNYVGNIAIFGQLADGSSAHAGHAAGADKSLSSDATLAYDVTRLVERLRGQPGFTGDLKLEFVPKGLEPPPGGALPEALPKKHDVTVARVRLVRE